MVKIGAFWERESSKDGKPYLKFTLDFPAKFIMDDTISIVCFLNKYKERNPDAPTWDVFIDKIKPRQPKTNAGKSDFDSNTPF